MYYDSVLLPRHSTKNNKWGPFLAPCSAKSPPVPWQVTQSNFIENLFIPRQGVIDDPNNNLYKNEPTCYLFIWGLNQSYSLELESEEISRDYLAFDQDLGRSSPPQLRQLEMFLSSSLLKTSASRIQQKRRSNAKLTLQLVFSLATCAYANASNRGHFLMRCWNGWAR